MRTTITIADDVYREAKARAAQSARTVSELIEEAVRASLRAEPSAPDRLSPLPTFGGGGVRPGVDLSDRRSLPDVLDDGRGLDALR